MPMDNEKLEQIIAQHEGRPGSLIHVLMAIQHENHWLPRPALIQVSRRLEVPLSRVLQVATFYKTFSLIPKGRHEVSVCTGSSCHVRGSAALLEKVQELTGIKPGETDAEGKFSLETGNCLGCCNLGPEIVINGKHYGQVTPDAAADVLDNCE